MKKDMLIRNVDVAVMKKFRKMAVDQECTQGRLLKNLCELSTGKL